MRSDPAAPYTGSMSTWAFSFTPSLTSRLKWIGTLGMRARSRSRLTSRDSNPAPVFTIARPATDSGRSIHVDMIMPPYFSTFSVA